jgi:hypothetical protein
VSQQRFGSRGSSLNAAGLTPSSSSSSAATEAIVRQLIAGGDHKTALDRAKEIHRASRTAASEALLVDAYAERIRSLIHRNLTLEAKSLIEFVRQRYPSARMRVDDLTTRVGAKPGSLDELVRPLNDPALDAARRAAIERALQRDVCDLAALAGCEALPVEHPLRKAASALERAFVAATSGAVAEDVLALPEVSHRSPLAPWKQLTRAIASFYRHEDTACRRYLDAIDRESAPARLVPAIQAMLTGKAAARLTPEAAALRAQITRASTLRAALQTLDQAFASGNKGRILKAIPPVVDQCQQSSPGRLESFRQHISVRCAVADLDPVKVMRAMGGPSRHDATFLRLFARGMEESRDPEHVVLACKLWEEFRHTAVQEGWFAANGREAAALSLHIADLLRQLPEELLRELQRSARSQAKASGEKMSFLFPEELYQRACVLDPHPEAFSQWMDWAARQPGEQAERVAAAWHQIRPRDIEPLLRLMKAAAEARGAFTSALGYLAKVEQIDGLHSSTREMRFRLLAGSALRHLQQKKPALAAEDLAGMAALPQAQQGDRSAFLAALRVVMSAAARGNGEHAAACRADVERLLGSSAAAAMLLFAVATASKQRALGQLGPVEELSRAERAALPGALARVTALAADMQLKLQIPESWMHEVARQFPASRQGLGTGELRKLAESALLAGDADLAYAISAAGLERGGATEARFLLLRARSVAGQFGRRVVCAKAAAELGRQQQDMELVEEAVELVRGPFEFDQVSLTLDQARDVLRKEKAAPEPPGKNRRGPDYGDLIGDTACQCAACRQARGEVVDPFDDLDGDRDDEEDFGFEIPPGMPPEIAAMFAEEVERAVRRGESFQEFLARLLAGGLAPRRRRKRRLR